MKAQLFLSNLSKRAAGHLRRVTCGSLCSDAPAGHFQRLPPKMSSLVAGKSSGARSIRIEAPLGPKHRSKSSPTQGAPMQSPVHSKTAHSRPRRSNTRSSAGRSQIKTHAVESFSKPSQSTMAANPVQANPTQSTPTQACSPNTCIDVQANPSKSKVQSNLQVSPGPSGAPSARSRALQAHAQVHLCPLKNSPS